MDNDALNVRGDPAQQHISIMAEQDTKPDPTIDTKPDLTIDTKPDLTIDTKPDITIDTKPDLTIDTKPDITIDTKPDPTIDTKLFLPVAPNGASHPRNPGRVGEPSQGVRKENPQPKKRQSNDIPKTPKAKKSKKPKDNTNPVCSCTGVAKQCYRWGCGWQSVCCTAQRSIYPLPMNTKRPGARITGRKMSQGAYKKVQEKLAAEGYDFANPIDLKTHWAKHGTNKFVTKR